MASLTVLIFATLLFCCVISCALDRDNDALRYLRTKYRTSRFNTARSRFLRSGPNYAPVGQESRPNVKVDAPLKREVAWKKLSGDIFRKPSCPMFLSILFGTGMQILLLFVSILLATFCGSVSPFNFYTVKGMIVLMFPICGVINGFAAGRMYAFLHGTDWINLWLATSFFLPYVVGSVLIAVDVCEYIETKKAYTVTLSEGLAMTALFVAINLPANFIGTVFGYKMAPIETPTKVSRMPREPPKGLPWFLNFHLMSIISGCVPVFVIGFELYQILMCIKGSAYIYLMYWSFYAGFIVFIIVVGQLSIMQ